MTDVAFFLVNLDGGGAEKIMISLANGLAECGLKVDVVVAVLRGEYLSLISPQVRLINLESKRLISSLPTLITYLKREQPLVLISALDDPNTIAIVAKKLAGVSTSVILTLHSHISNAARYSSNIKGKLSPLFARFTLPLADGVVAVSQGVAEDAATISKLPLAKIKVIYNPIFTDELENKFREKVEHSWFDDRQIPVILAVGRLNKAKDFPTLIRAFAIVQQQHPARLMILGQGEELNNLEELVNKLNLTASVHFVGFVENPYAYMKQASLVVLSSVYEGFGNVLVEAMLAGTPVVSTDCQSGPSEILANGKYGSLVNVGDVSSLAAAMVNTLNNPPDAQFLKNRGAEFSLSSSIAKYRELINI